eukprot:471860-Rhodomonas_salina.1
MLQSCALPSAREDSFVMVKSCRKPSRRTASCHSTAMKISPINNLTEGFHSVERSSKVIEMLPSSMSLRQNWKAENSRIEAEGMVIVLRSQCAIQHAIA